MSLEVRKAWERFPWQQTAKMRPKMAKMRPKMAKMRPKTAKMRPKMAKTRPKMAKLRPKMPKMRAQEGQDEAQEGPKKVKNHGIFFFFKIFLATMGQFSFTLAMRYPKQAQEASFLTTLVRPLA